MKRLCIILVLMLAGGGAAAGAAPPPQPILLVVGDSLGAGLGIDTERGWVRLLQQRVTAEGYPHRIVNASVSGETTLGGRTRLPHLIDEHHPAIVILELGGNDGLQGLPLGAMANNLEQMIRTAKASGALPLLMEMRLPPNLGPIYTERFTATFSQVAKRLQVPLLPFLLEGVAGNPELMQRDGIHPSEAGQPQILENIWPRIRSALDSNRQPAER